MKTFLRLAIAMAILSSNAYAQQQGPKQTSIKWQFKTTAPIVGSPKVKDQLLFIGSADSCLYALNKLDGKSVWHFRTEGKITSTVGYDNSNVYFISEDAYIYALDILTGQLRWRYKTGGERSTDPWDYFLSSPVLDNGMLYIGSTDGNIYAIEAANGTLKWKYATGGAVHAAPVVADNTIMAGSFDGWFYALNTDGTLKWKFDTMGERFFPIGEVQYPAVVKDTCVYFCARDYNVYALHLNSGKGLWVFHEPGSWANAPSLDGNTLVVTTSDTRRVIGLDAMYGGFKWASPVNLNVFSAVAAANNYGYMGTLDGQLYGVDLKTGKSKLLFQTAARTKNVNRFFNKATGKLYTDLVDRYKGDVIKIYADFLDMGSILSTPLVESGVLYFGSTDGNVYALK
ncbi:hypothetical protein DVR12_04260 [Chitinophaga silvatica]|uniref:Pyrrolo-quinoline quinone repeat domain-containing protein n=1 Tax=Chitinophaga silvatica TaxID=2282649 RepID=A0A3E1YHV9_9BACT|nr:PQQ-binding-like beta-propeller repeat protein [Chitinophaga silvatica]RFS27003.1 hypothetical protein DVR12_04260 [Chitinophaga silvatica]